jgi:mannosyltransferase OCH1-like enzyme
LLTLNRYYYAVQAALLGQLPLAPLCNAPASAAYAHSRIPPFVYQTWKTNSFGRSHFRQLQRFRQLNPELSFVLFDDAEMSDYMQQHWAQHPIYGIFQNAHYGQLKTDIFRYCILHERGGFYFDISKGVSAPICSFLRPDGEALITYEKTDCVIAPEPVLYERQLHPDKLIAQYGLGFTPRHPVLGAMIENMCKYYRVFQGRVFHKPKFGILSFTGPGMFTKTVREHLLVAPDPHLIQAGVDFNGKSIWSMRGAYVRFSATPPYKHARNGAIVS